MVNALHLTWTGLAAQAHQLAHTEWVDGVHGVREGLQETADAARLAHGNHHGAATTNQEMWGPLA